MKLLVTGGTGFVMSVLGRRWLDTDTSARLIVLDAAKSPNQLAVEIAARLGLVAEDT